MSLSRRIARTDFERRGRRVCVSTCMFEEPVSYMIAAVPQVSYNGETIVWVDDRIVQMLRYGPFVDDDWLACKHAAIVHRAKPGSLQRVA